MKHAALECFSIAHGRNMNVQPGPGFEEGGDVGRRCCVVERKVTVEDVACGVKRVIQTRVSNRCDEGLNIQTIYSINAGDDEKVGQARLAERLRGAWSLPTALAFLAWFVFAPQCISTIAVTRRETNGWKWPLFMVSYLFALAYLAAGATYWIAVAAGLS